MTNKQKLARYGIALENSILFARDPRVGLDLEAAELEIRENHLDHGDAYENVVRIAGRTCRLIGYRDRPRWEL
jgi:hypothetical protein